MSNIFMRFPEGKKKALTLSYDDGVQQDEKLIEIINRYGLKGTFNINSGLFCDDGTVFSKGQIHRRMTKKELVELYKDSRHEVAIHGLTHPFLEQLPSNMASYEIIKDRDNLEKIFGTIIRGMAYPYGTYNDELIEILKCAGIVYSRTVASTEKFDIPTDWLRLPATCHHKNENLMVLAEKFVNGEPTVTPWLFYLWGHSYEFEADNNWNVIENFAEKIGYKDDIWYATNIEIYDYIDQYNRLQFSVGGKMVKNNTATDLFFEMDKVLFKVKAGEFLYM